MTAGHRHKGEHVVQFYGKDKQRLAANVARYLGDSLREGGAGLVVAARSQREAILHEVAHLSIPDLHLPGDRLVLLDDVETLASFMREGRPSRELFNSAVGSVARDLLTRYGRLRAYGEMVGRLWAERAFTAAIELEELWNELLTTLDFDLYCGYPIDVLSPEFQIPAMRPLLEKHSRLVPTLSDDFHRAMRRAMGEVLGDRPHGLHSAETSLPNAEGTILRLRSTLPRYVDEILAKARQYQQA